MKKITFLVAAVLASASMSAQTVQKWMAFEEDITETSILFPWNTTLQSWCAEDGNVETSSERAFQSGDIALFNDEVLPILTDEDLYGDLASASPTITVGQIDAIGGLRVENSEVTYHFVPASETVTFEGPEGAAVVKSNDGIMYTDVVNNLPGGTVIKGGTVARNSSASAESRVFGATVAVEGTGTVDLGGNSGTPYFKLNADLSIPEGSTMNVYMARYSMFTSDSVKKVTGAGTLNFYGRGERAFLGGGSKGESEPTDFTGFSGDIHVYGDKSSTESAGFYGVIFPANSAKGKAATAEYFDRLSGDSLLYNVWKTDKVLLDSLVYDLTDVDLTVHGDAAIAVGSAGNESGSNVTILRVKSLAMENKSVARGYYKASNPQLAIMFGSDNADGHLDGVFTSCVKGAADTGWSPYKESAVGLFKEGTGTYYLTSNENQLYLGVEVWEGRMLFNNAEPETSTATGQHKVSTNNTVTCRPTGTIGGYGTIGGHTALYGTLQPGSDAIGTLRIDGSYAKVSYVDGSKDSPVKTVQQGNTIFARTEGTDANLLIYNNANMEFEIINKDKHDEVLVENEIRVYSDVEGGTEAKINVKLSPRDNWSVAEGDSIVLMQADTLKSYVDGVTDENCFNLVVDEAFNGAQFKLVSVKIPSVVNSYYDPVSGTIKEEVIAPAQYKLVAVVTAAGSGEAEPDAIESVDADNSNLQVYPNPAVDGNVTIAVAAGEVAHVAIYNSAAQMVKSVATSESTLTLDVSDLQAGIYYVRVMTADKAYTQKLIVE